MTLETIDIKILDERATIPTRSHSTDAGLDLYASESVWVDEGTLISTGIAVDIPPGFEGTVRPRSGLTSRTGLRVQLGTVDSGYNGEIKVIADYLPQGDVGDQLYAVSTGDKIAQLVLSPIETPAVNVVKDFDGETERGENGFGSTDNPKQRAKEAEQFFSGMHGGW